MLRLSTECCVKGDYLHCVDVIAVGIEDYRLETDVRSTNSSMDATDRYKVLLGPSIGLAAILVRCHVFFSTALVSQRQLMTSSLVGVRTVRGQRTFMYVIGVTLPVSRKRCSSLLDDVDRDKIARISVQ
jgi:hypothetical protein